MEETKTRQESLVTTLEKLTSNAHPTAFLETEFCYLQVRRICELLALAVLAAHNSLPGARTSQLMTAWHADKIFKKLARLNPMGFPSPFRGSIPDGGISHFEPIKNPFIDANELGKIYATCGDKLHVGKFSHILNKFQKTYDVGELRKWCAGLSELLSEHMIMLPEFQAVLVATLDTSDTQQVSVFLGVPDLETSEGALTGICRIRAI